MAGQPDIPPFAQAAAGAAGSIVSNTIVYPLDLISTRVQTSGSRSQAKSPLAAICDAVKTKGVRGLYQGLGTDNLSNTLSNFLFFFFRAAIVERIHARQSSSSSSASSSKSRAPPPLTPGQDLAAGALAGVFSRALTTPLSNVTVRKQTHSSSSSGKGGAKGKGKGKARQEGDEEDESSSDEETTFEDEPSIMDIVNEILNDKGIVGLWSGFETAILLSTTPALTFYLTNIYTRLLFSSSRRSSAARRDEAKSRQQTSQTPLQIFLSSALGNATSTTLLYPLILAKTLLQYRSPHTGRRTYRNLGDVLIQVGQGKRGVAGLYQGLESQLIKGVISHGVTMLVKSRVELGFVWLYLWMKGRRK